MDAVLRICDEMPGQPRRSVRTLKLASERISATELIKRRVRAEVEEHNASANEVYWGLVQPANSERVLNGYRLWTKRSLDPDEQIRIALEAFSRNGFVLLLDDRQIEDLNEMIVLTGDNTATFIRLVPLVGG